MQIPKEVQNIIKALNKKGFEAYAVGGCVRDFLLEKKPSDWDVTTNAKPQEIQKIFPENFYNNQFGTVTVQTDSQETTLKNIEITTYRIEAEYTDKRHPDKIEFASSLEEDLSRRDFTINAMAMAPESDPAVLREDRLCDTKRSKPVQTEGEVPKPRLIDPFNGQEDLENKIIRAVGDANERFNEDALRMLRAIRFAVQLGFEIEKNTFEAIKKNAGLLEKISKERIRDEFEQMILSDKPDEAILTLKDSKLMSFVIPELLHGIRVKQNKHHVYDVFEHSVLSLKFCKSPKLEVRLAALLHDIAKPAVKHGEGYNSTFYNHDHLGAKFAKSFLQRLHFPNEIIDKVYTLVYNHMFYYDMGIVTEAAVRRMIKRVGKENLKDLIELRIADRLGSGAPKAKPYRLRHLEYMFDKVQYDPVSVKMLKINGDDLMRELKLQPSPTIGAILDALLAEVIENPKLNEKPYLLARSHDLARLDLTKIREFAKEKIETKKEEEDTAIKKRHWVK
ncbi:MAG: HD domain-containing protein [bacterium]